MIRTFNFPMRPTAAEERVLEATLILCQQLYNVALEARREAYRKQRASTTLYDQYKELTDLRAADPEYAGVSAWILRSALCRLDSAFKGFFRRVKAGQTPGFPRFKSRDRYTAFSFPPPTRDGKFLVGDRVLIPRIGAVKINLYRPIPLGAVIKTAHVKRCGDKWTVSLVVDLGAAPEKKDRPKTSIGIDVGVTTFATLSTGVGIENPRFACASEGVVARRHRTASRKCRGSKSYKRAWNSVGRALGHVGNQRLDFARKEAKKLFDQFDLIIFEDLNIRGLVQGTLGKSINDAGWGVFIRCLQSKAEKAGKWVVAVNPNATSIECSSCGERVTKALSERVHRCPRCGLVLGRDHNAAINIHARGLRVLEDCTKVQPECEASNGSGTAHGKNYTVLCTAAALR